MKRLRKILRESGERKPKRRLSKEKKKEKNFSYKRWLIHHSLRNCLLTASFAHLQYSVIEQCDGCELLPIAKNLC